MRSKPTLKYSLAILIIFFCVNANGQKLIESRQTSYYTYIYQLTDEEAETVYKSKLWEVTPSFFHTLVDSFPTDSVYDRRLPAGHYIKTFAEKNEQKIAITTVQDFNIYILNNNTDLRVQVYDLKGEIVPDAELKVKKKRLRFDEKSQCYIEKKSNRKGLLEVTHEGFTAYYDLSRNRNHSAFKRGFRKVTYGTPLKYVWRPVRFVLGAPMDAVKSIKNGYPQGSIYRTRHFFRTAPKKIACAFGDWWYCDDYRFRKKYTGYMVFNKPKYLPKDTVKFKAFLVTKKGKPLNKQVNVVLYDRKDKKLSQLKPYRKGGYTDEFVLHDSLELKLDDRYRIELQNQKGKVYISSSFKYEDYELTKTKLAIRLDDKEQFRNQERTLYIKGTDENDLNILDGRIEVLIRPIEIDEYFDNQIFVPDTLLFQEQELEPTGETEIMLPDTLFPKINLEYEVNVKLLTSDNEVKSQKNTISFFYQSKAFDAEVLTDSIRFFYKENGLAKPRKVKISGGDNFGNNTLIYEGNTPYTLELNPYYALYRIESDSLSETIKMKEESSLLECYAQRTSDSIFIDVDNPRNIPFNYNIYKKNTEKYVGYTDSLNLKKKTTTRQNYFISMSYLWAGKVVTEDYNIPLIDKKLTVTVTEPKIVYPGEKTRIEVLVTDVNGKPVDNVDITAYGLTKKFNDSPPKLPYLGKSRKGKDYINNFEVEEDEPSKYQNLKLDYAAWKALASLDSIGYYKFIYPKKDSIYRFEYTTADSVTQFSPFVVEDGAMLPIHVVYVNNKPVYFSWSTHGQPYSFKIDSGFHQIKLRTTNREITIDSMYFEAGKRLIFSLNEDIKSTNINSYKLKSELGQSERRLLNKYIFPYRSNFGGNYAYIEQNGQIQALNQTRRGRNYAGPVVGMVDFHLIDSFSTTFMHEPFFEYDFAPNLLKMRSVDAENYPKHLDSYAPRTSLASEYITKTAFHKEWEQELARRIQAQAKYLTPTAYLNIGRVKVSLTGELAEEIPKNILIFEQETNKLVGLFRGFLSLSTALEAGEYNVVFFYEDGKYLAENLIIKPHGLNYYEYNQAEFSEKDAFSIYLKNLIYEVTLGIKNPYKNPKNEKAAPKKTYDLGYIGDVIEGRLCDETGEGLPFASVFIKGTDIGTTTDLDGNYSIKVPLDCNTLTFVYIGYSDKEIVLGNSNIVNANMDPGAMNLDEVVVVGYGVKQKRSLSYSVATVSSEDISDLPTRSVSTLIATTAAGVTGSNGQDISFRGAREGDQIVYVDGVRVRGVSVPATGDNTLKELSLKMRGASSINQSSEPLYIVNGNVYNGDISKIDPASIKNIYVLRGSEATELYGAKAANGVILIETTQASNKGADYDSVFFERASQASSIRENFSDYAFWQPTLTTNKDGKATFELTFPDDVTSWQTHYLAMNGKRQSGQTAGFVKSYKPLMAQLAVPRFLIESDTTYAIGKVLNYSPDSIKVNTQFELDGETLYENTEYCTHSIIDTLTVSAASDSLSVKYMVENQDGYFDGERRDIPVFPLGLEETEGQFYVLENDTTVNLTFNPQLGTVNLYARADMLDVIGDEIRHLIRYKYLCNEQIASKLKALLAAKKIAQYKGEEFKYEKNIKKLIRLLKKNEKSRGLWGWWKDSERSEWISLHALEALTQAEKMAYNGYIEKGQIAKNFVWKLEEGRNFYETVRALKILHLLDVQIDAPKYIADLEETKDTSSLHHDLQILELKQLYKMDYDVDTLASFMQTTLFGNIYFAEQFDEKKSRLLFNEVQNTLLAYKILKADSTKHDKTLFKMRNYFMENRRTGYWRNTYESAQIIETILPDLLGEKTKLTKPKLTIAGDINEVVSEFPFELQAQPNQQIQVNKSGDFPVYFTAYQRYQNRNPDIKKGDFEITTKFENKSGRDAINRVSTLTAGQQTKLIVEVTVKKDAEYVMINVPIPGGCSYADKRKYYRNEVHREYFKHETAIFCQKLLKGKYTYEINLTPRYSGNYTLNPAKVELMYFPVFSANNGVKKVGIR